MHFNLEQECRYPMIPGLFLENVIAISYFHWSLLEVILLNPEVCEYNLGVALNSFEFHCKYFPSFCSSKGT
jgi:hypothetical protein